MKVRYVVLISLFACFATFAPAVAAKALPGKAWTFLVYMAADNSLDTMSTYSLDLLQKGLTKDTDVNILVLRDRLGLSADLLRVTSTGITTLPSDYGEPDMANPATLDKFITWGVTNYPASRYVLSIWSHGGGWKYIILDSTSGTRMSLDGLQGAMKTAQDKTGKKIDVTIFDACLMSLIEVADQLRDATGYVVASEQSVPGEGFPYTQMVQRIVASPQIGTGVYANAIADDYFNKYATANSKSFLSISAIDESKVKDLATSIDTISLTLLANMPAYTSAIGSARSNAQHQVLGVNGVFWYVDIVNFMDQLSKRVSNSTVKTQAATVIAKVGAAVYQRHSHNLDGTAYGLGINFPPNMSKYQDKSFLAQNYQNINLVFTAETHWDDMLLASY